MSGHEQSPRVTNHFVYRLHGTSGEVIYVGRSVNVARRISKHNTFPRKPWIEDVRSVSMFGPLSREQAIAAERREISRLQPPGNIALTARDHRPFVAHMSKQAAGAAPTGEQLDDDVARCTSTSGVNPFDIEKLAEAIWDAMPAHHTGWRGLSNDERDFYRGLAVRLRQDYLADVVRRHGDERAAAALRETADRLDDHTSCDCEDGDHLTRFIGSPALRRRAAQIVAC